jgi:hypothetical protein
VIIQTIVVDVTSSNARAAATQTRTDAKTFDTRRRQRAAPTVRVGVCCARTRCKIADTKKPALGRLVVTH